MTTIWHMILGILWVLGSSLLDAKVDAKSIWSRKPVNPRSIMRESYPVGNGKMGLMSYGQPGQEKLNINIDSLWSGGPFESAQYNGGNPSNLDKSQHLKGIRDYIFQTGTGNVTDLLGSNNHYGSFRVLGNIIVTIEGIHSYKSFNRSLDLTNGIHRTTFMGNDFNTYNTETYCSYPGGVCVYRISSSGKLPNVAVSVENRVDNPRLYKTTCGPSLVRLTGITQESDPVGMEYDMLVRLSTGPLGMPMSSCSTNRNGTLVVSGSAYGKDMPLNTFAFIIGAATDYDATKGNAENQYSFKGAKPGPALEKRTAQMSTRLENKLNIAHVQDYQRLMNEFRIDLYDPWKTSKYPSETLEFTQLLDRYRYNSGMTNSRAETKRKRERKHKNKKIKEERSKRSVKDSNQKLESNVINNDIENSARILQYAPTSTTQSNSWNTIENLPQTSDFPQFPYPTILAEGNTPKSAVPWSSNGLVTATGHDGLLHTVTLTKSTTIPTSDVGMIAEPSVVGFNAFLLPPERVDTEAIMINDDQSTGPDLASIKGDSYVESLLFEYARHLYISSAREDSLPPNLQGVWVDDLEAAWSGDYHANINMQMTHSFADQTGLGSLQNSLWNFIEHTWVPRGSETARLLYNGTGWVTHDEMNIFGHTGMKNSASWGNYPIASAWMMQYFFDHYDYSRDLSWLQRQGYAIVRSATQFWLSQLVPDTFFQDGTLIALPCNSPERDPTTFACAHWQQLLHQLFTHTLTLGTAVNDADGAFLARVDAARTSVDRGIHAASWGGLREFKLPEARGLDSPADTRALQRRHLAQLVGWFPGHSVAAYAGGYTNVALQRAVAATLRAKGNGAADGNAGWAKLWRGAAWARLNDTERADYQLRFAVHANVGPNGLSIYDGGSGPVQVDSNFGIAGTMLAMLIVDLPAPYPTAGAAVVEKRSVVLGPAIPVRWGPGSVTGLRIRGGTVLNLEWNAKGVVDKVSITKRGEACKFYSKDGRKIGEI